MTPGHLWFHFPSMGRLDKWNWGLPTPLPLMVRGMLGRLAGLGNLTAWLSWVGCLLVVWQALKCHMEEVGLLSGKLRA